MKLTWRSLVHKCLLKSKTEVYILYKRVWSNQETGSKNEGGGATSSEAAWEYFGAKWCLAYCYKEWSVDPKISCMIKFSGVFSNGHFLNPSHFKYSPKLYLLLSLSASLILFSLSCLLHTPFIPVSVLYKKKIIWTTGNIE